jgi:hypothetical protein
MGHPSKLRFTALAGAVACLLLTTTAWGKPVLREHLHNEGTIPVEDFCGVPGLDVEIAFVADVTVLANRHGRDGLVYFLEHFSETGVHTNIANGKTVTQVSKGVRHDLHITDNGDGTLTILASATGNDVLYGPTGKVLARNPGQSRFQFLIDHGGTPADPFDDEFLAFEVVKGSTGRNDDFCAAAEMALT